MRVEQKNLSYSLTSDAKMTSESFDGNLVSTCSSILLFLSLSACPIDLHKTCASPGEFVME